MEEKSKDLAKLQQWREYYNKNKFKYLKRRLMKRVKSGVNVKYTTLVKYDMIGYYLDNCNETQKEIFDKQKEFFNTMNDVTNLQHQTEAKLENAIQSIIGKNADLKIQIIKNDPNIEVVDEAVDTTYNLQTAIHDIKYNAVNKHNKPLKDTTKRNQLNHLYKLVQLLNCEDDFAVLKLPSSLQAINALPQQQKINIINLINSIHRYSVKFKTMMAKDIVMYKTELNSIFQKKKKQDLQNRQNKVRVEWSNVLAMYNKMEKEYKIKLKEYKKYMMNADKTEMKEEFYKLNQAYLLLSLFVLRPPLRGGDYMKINVVDELPVLDRRHQQLVDTDSKTKLIENYYLKPFHAFVFQQYKTNHLYHQVWFEQTSKSLPNYFGKRTKLINIINESLTMFPRPYLLCKKNYLLYKSTEIFNLLSNHIKKRITANKLRHSYITYQYETLKIKDRKKKKLARLMLHQPSTAEQNYLQVVE